MANFFAFYPSDSGSLPVGGATAANQVLEIALLTSIDGKLKAESAATAAITNPTASASSFAIVASNPARIGLRVSNDTNQPMRVAFAATATTALYTLSIFPGSYWNMEKPIYTGAVSAICDGTPSGTVTATEM